MPPKKAVVELTGLTSKYLKSEVFQARLLFRVFQLRSLVMQRLWGQGMCSSLEALTKGVLRQQNSYFRLQVAAK